jgi:hypothetical protein
MPDSKTRNQATHHISTSRTIPYFPHELVTAPFFPKSFSFFFFFFSFLFLSLSLSFSFLLLLSFSFLRLLSSSSLSFLLRRRLLRLSSSESDSLSDSALESEYDDSDSDSDEEPELSLRLRRRRRRSLSFLRRFLRPLESSPELSLSSSRRFDLPRWLRSPRSSPSTSIDLLRLRAAATSSSSTRSSRAEADPFWSFAMPTELGFRVAGVETRLRVVREANGNWGGRRGGERETL